MRLPENFEWLDLPLQAWVDWANNDRIGLGYATLSPDRMPTCRMRPAISMPEPIVHIERAICSLPPMWREVVKAEWVFRWPHWYAAKRFRISRPTHLAWRKHAYAVIADYLVDSLEREVNTIFSVNGFTKDPEYSTCSPNLGLASPNTNA